MLLVTKRWAFEDAQSVHVGRADRALVEGVCRITAAAKSLPRQSFPIMNHPLLVKSLLLSAALATAARADQPAPPAPAALSPAVLPGGQSEGVKLCILPSQLVDGLARAASRRQ